MFQQVKSKIVDVYGRHFSSKQAKEQQTDKAEVAALHRTFSEHPSSGLTPAGAAQILLSAERGDLIAQCELAEDIEEKDGHLYAELDKRKRSLLTVDWFLEPPRDATEQEREDTLYIQGMLEDLNFMPVLIKDMADAILKGFSCNELQWQRDGSTWFVEAPEYRDPSWFQTHSIRRDELRLRDSSHEGAELWPFSWIKHEHKAKSGYISRAGLVRQLVWPFIFKNYSVRDLAEFLEIYGLPLRIGQYPAGANVDEKRALLQAVMSIGHNAGGIMPKGMVMDFHSAATGQADPFELMMNWAEKTMSKVILGGTLTSQADGKSSTNALGSVHNEVREELRNSDLAQIGSTLSRDLVFPLYAFNCKSFSHNRRYPKLVFDTTAPSDLKDLATPLKTLVSIGMQVPASWAHEKTRIPQAKDGEEVLSVAQRQTQAAELIDQRQEALAALNADDEAEVKDNSEQMSDRLAKDASKLMGQLMSPVANAVLGATSLEQLRDDITKLEDELDSETLENQLQLAIAAAYLLGQLEVEEGE